MMMKIVNRAMWIVLGGQITLNVFYFEVGDRIGMICGCITIAMVVGMISMSEAA